MLRVLTGMILAGGLTLAANSFESAEDAAKVTGRVALDESIYRFGTRSLRWDARPGESITLTLPVAESRRRELSFFLYNPAESKSKIEVVIGDPPRKCDYKFDIPLNFKFWRPIRVAPFEDLKPVANRAATEQVTMTYRGEKPVELYLDAVSPVASWQRVGNFQLPFVNPKRPAMTQSEVPGNVFMSEYRKLESRFAKAPPVSDFQRESLRELRKRMHAWLKNSGLPADDPLVAARHQIILSAARESLERYRSWDIRQAGGKYLFKSGPEPRDGYDNLWRDMAAKTCFPLAYAYSIDFPGNEFYQKPEIRDAVLNILGLLRYQGFAEGADHNWHAMFVTWGLGQTLFLMPKELKEAGLFDDLRKAQLWYSRFNTFAIAPGKWSPPSADVLRTGMVDTLCSILTMDDAEANVRLLALRQILDEQLVITGGYGDLIKPDGSTFHHGQVAHAAYGPDGLLSLATMAYLLRGTPYAVNSGKLAELHRALVTFDRQQQKFDTPAATNVRWAFYDAAARPLVSAYAYALLLDPSDREIAAIFKRQFQENELVKSNFRFLNYSDSEGQLGVMRQAAAQADKIVREKVAPPQGAFNYYNSALLIHRRDNWMAAIRGFSKYAWDFEVGSRNPKGYENKYCRFVSHGTMQIFG
ncbi:MAG: chondroitinase family polysaccharide lyase, partial [Victivallaceae bacterium]